MPVLDWLTRKEDLRAADLVPYRLLDEVPDLSHGAGEECMLAHGDNFETEAKIAARQNLDDDYARIVVDAS